MPFFLKKSHSFHPTSGLERVSSGLRVVALLFIEKMNGLSACFN